jgi:hypothetical protein
VKTADPNLPLLEAVTHALGPLCDQFVFIGGCATGLLVTDAAASPVRATRDVDVVVEVVSLAGYHALERQLEQAGFKHDRSPDAPVCRWIVGRCMLDVMPTDKDVHGRGGGDFLASHDLEDIAVVIDGRPELVDEVATCEAVLRSYLADEIGSLLRNAAFLEALSGHLPGDETSQARLPIIRERLRLINEGPAPPQARP